VKGASPGEVAKHRKAEAMDVAKPKGAIGSSWPPLRQGTRLIKVSAKATKKEPAISAYLQKLSVQQTTTSTNLFS